MERKIILASGSPRRRELLAQLGLQFTVQPSGAEEKTDAKEPKELVKELASLKARDIFETLAESEKETTIVIGADTVVALNGSVMGKPANFDDAVNMLLRLQGKTHQVYTGVSLLFQKEGEQKSTVFFEKTDVIVYPMSEEEILAYVKTGEPMDKAGGYGIQGKFAAYIKAISGDYSNVVGLPIGRLYQEMKQLISL